jgi:hypothetical protein
MLSDVRATSIGTTTTETAARSGLSAAEVTFRWVSPINLTTGAACTGMKLNVDVTS